MHAFAPKKDFSPRGLAALGASLLSLSVAHALDVELRFQPDGGNEAARASALAAQHGSTVTATQKNGVWTLRNVRDEALVAVRERADVTWAEAVFAPAMRSANAAIEAKRSEKFHPRMLKVTLNADVSVSTESAKRTLLPSLQTLSAQPLQLARVKPNSVSVMLPMGADAQAMEDATLALQSHPDVASVDRMRIVKPYAAQPFAPNNQPNDPMWNLQWALNHPIAGINVMDAWRNAGTSPVTVAVIDTGSTPHPDLDAKTLPGYDMVSERLIGVDGDGRDGNPNDDGDYSEYGECSYYHRGSSWHGTHVAGIIAAQTNNGEGIAGVAPNARIQHVRALGRCGGLIEDVADGIRWAAGVPVPGAPINRNPAKVINMSLGGTGLCTPNEQDAIDSAIARGAIIVVAAGNDAEDARFFSPANCKGVITVAASNRDGKVSSFSNGGDLIKITAPGGDYDGYEQIVSTLNAGGAGQSTTFYQPYAGTSMAAPHIAGVVALMLSRDPSMTSGQVLNRLQSSARANGLPGAGLVDAAAAVLAVADQRTPNQKSTVAGRMRMLELWDRVTNKFIITSDLREMQDHLSGKFGGNWVATGAAADAFDFTAAPPGFVLPQPVCRYRSAINGAVRLSADVGVCNAWRDTGVWLNDGYVFQAAIANGGTCLAGGVPVYEMVADSRYRYAIGTAERNTSAAFGWGGGQGAAFCLPAQ